MIKNDVGKNIKARVSTGKLCASTVETHGRASLHNVNSIHFKNLSHPIDSLHSDGRASLQSDNSPPPGNTLHPDGNVPLRYKNKYRVESTRLKNWDYSSNGCYFITICTKNRECLCGDIIDGNMILSEIGKIVETEWLKSFEIRAELFSDEYCIMPNHIHGIVIINNADAVHNVDIVETHHRSSLMHIKQ